MTSRTDFHIFVITSDGEDVEVHPHVASPGLMAKMEVHPHVAIFRPPRRTDGEDVEVRPHVAVPTSNMGLSVPPAQAGGGSLSVRALPKTFERGGTDLMSHTLPPTTEPRPITVSPPRMVAPE